MPRCKACGTRYRLIGTEALTCPECGAGLGERARNAGDAVDARIEERLALRTGAGADIRPPPARAQAEPETTGFSFPDGFLPDASEVGELRNLVFQAQHVVSNPDYAEKTRGTRFRYDADDPDFNAYASQGFVGPEIVILGGLVHEFAVMALHTAPPGVAQQAETSALALYMDRRAASPAPAAAVPLTSSDPVLLRWQRELLSAMVMFVIGHELGHVCYAHIYGPGYSGQPLDVCRNQERDADSFAASVIAASTFADSWLFGQLAALLTMALKESEGVITEYGTHPTARERLLNAVRNNHEAAESLGITEEMVERWVPPAS